LAGGANQPILAIVAFSVIVLIIYISKLLGKREKFQQSGRLFVNIQTDIDDLKQITSLLSKHLPYVELKRMDTLEQGLDLAFICQARTVEQLAELKDELRALSPQTRLSIIDQPDLIV